MSRKGPYLPWFPKDIMGDTALQSVSNAAFGLWHKMLYIAHHGEPYGHLSVNGSVIPTDKLARMCFTAPEEFGLLVTELDQAGVFSRTPDGVIFSRRMVRDAQRSETARKNGARGGSPLLRSGDSRLTEQDNQKSKGGDIPFLGIWSLVLVSGIGSEGKGSGETDPNAVRSPFVGTAFTAAWHKWLKNLADQGLGYSTPQQAENALALLAPFDEAYATGLLERAAAAKWKGFVFDDSLAKYQRTKSPASPANPGAGRGPAPHRPTMGQRSQETIQDRSKRPETLKDYVAKNA